MTKYEVTAHFIVDVDAANEADAIKEAESCLAEDGPDWTVEERSP